jgi:hypothetical protein
MMNCNDSKEDAAVLLDELTVILGSGRFTTLFKHLRTHLPSLHAAARQHHRLFPASAVEKDAHHQLCGSLEDEADPEEIMQGDDELLVAEIEERVTQLENVLTRYNNSRYDNTARKNCNYT